MDLQEVDPFAPDRRETLVGRALHVLGDLGRRQRLPARGGDRELGGDRALRAATRGTDDRLGIPVGGRGVDQRDASLERVLERATGGGRTWSGALAARRAVGRGQRGRADAQCTDMQRCAAEHPPLRRQSSDR